MIYIYITYRISSSYIVANISSIARFFFSPGVSAVDPVGSRFQGPGASAACGVEPRGDRSRVAMAAMAAMAIEKHHMGVSENVVYP